MFLMLLSGTLSSWLNAQVQVRGKILNEENTPINGAQVQEEESGLFTKSDMDGNFFFSLPDAPSYTFWVEHNGYGRQSFVYAKNQLNGIVSIKLHKNIKHLETVQVSTTRISSMATSASDINVKRDLEKKNFGQDLPILLEAAPSVVTTSDAGAGVGYTGLRIRGVDASRINVTINGIPVNDPESHDVYWVNMPDLVGSIENFQLQRGVGSSTNGAAAFGASLNIKSKDISQNPYAEIDNSYGSFNTMKNAVKAGTGLINNKFSLDARLSRITSDGYIDRASSNLKSFYLSGAWVGKKSLFKAVVFSGKEITYQSWYGTPESRVKGDTAAMNAYADRNYLSDLERENLLNSGRTYNYYTYKNQNDNYQQDNYQLHFNHTFNSKWFMNLAAHYTYGRGYYEEYKNNQDLNQYGLANVIVGGDTVTSSDLIRRRWLDNDFVGGVYSLMYRENKWNVTLGGAANAYFGRHFGEVTWARFASDSEIDQRYYDNTANKWENSTYLKANYFINKFNFTGDLQYRHVNYSFLGIDEVNGELKEVEQNVQFNFVNPKISGIYRINGRQTLFASYGLAHREPVRKDFRESTPQNRPKAEVLRDLEVGYSIVGKNYNLTANVYWMDYTNQLILTGQINDVGGYTRTNVDDSYRAGIEINGSYKVLPFLRLNGAVTFSQNKIKQFNEYVDEYLDVEPYYTQQVIQHTNTNLAFSPNLTGNVGFSIMPLKNMTIDWMTKYVGRQFMDNTSNVNRSLDPFTFSNLTINYTLKNVFFNEIVIGGQLNNVFNAMYSNNGYTFSYISGGQTTTENFYYPQAGRNFMLRVLVRF